MALPAHVRAHVPLIALLGFAAACKDEGAKANAHESEVDRTGPSKASLLEGIAPSDRAWADGRWKVRYAFEEHIWELRGDTLIVDDEEKHVVGTSGFSITLRTHDGEKVAVNPLFGTKNLYVGAITRYGYFTADRYAALIGGAMLRLVDGKCEVYQADFEGRGDYKLPPAPAQCRIERRGERSFFVYEDVYSEFAEGKVSGELVADDGLLLVEDEMVDNRAVRLP